MNFKDLFQERLGFRKRVASSSIDGAIIENKGSFVKNYRQVNGLIALNHLETLYLLEKGSIALVSDKIPFSIQDAYCNWSIEYQSFRELKKMGFNIDVKGNLLQASKPRTQVQVVTVDARSKVTKTLKKNVAVAIVDGSDISFMKIKPVKTL